MQSASQQQVRLPLVPWLHSPVLGPQNQLLVSVQWGGCGKYGLQSHPAVLGA